MPNYQLRTKMWFSKKTRYTKLLHIIVGRLSEGNGANDISAVQIENESNVNSTSVFLSDPHEKIS